MLGLGCLQVQTESTAVLRACSISDWLGKRADCSPVPLRYRSTRHSRRLVRPHNAPCPVQKDAHVLLRPLPYQTKAQTLQTNLKSPEAQNTALKSYHFPSHGWESGCAYKVRAARVFDGPPLWQKYGQFCQGLVLCGSRGCPLQTGTPRTSGLHGARFCAQQSNRSGAKAASDRRKNMWLALKIKLRKRQRADFDLLTTLTCQCLKIALIRDPDSLKIAII